MKKKTVIFDLDGTIVDTGTPIANTINYVREYFNLSPMDKDEILTNVNCPKTHSPQFFYGVDEYTPKHIELFEAYYHEHCILDIETYDGMKTLLEETSRDFNLVVATNAFSSFAQRILESQNLYHHFSFLIGADQVSNAKPDPEMLFAVMKNFSDDAKDYVFIGDSKKDELAALSANISYLMVDWGFSVHENAHTKASHLQESIYEILNSKPSS